MEVRIRLLVTAAEIGIGNRLQSPGVQKGSEITAYRLSHCDGLGESGPTSQVYHRGH